MAKRGRKPKPSVLKLVAGNPGKRPINENEPVFRKIELPEPPEDMSRAGKIEWRRTGAVLIKSGVLTEGELPAFELYCDAWGFYQKATTAIRDDGLVLKSKSGALRVSPHVLVQIRYWNQCVKLLTEFGMTASSKSGISVLPGAPKKDDSGFLQYLDPE